MNLKNLGSLITYEQDGKEYCLGYLFDFTGHGVFSPDGKVEVTPEQAEIHNRLLAEAELAGLEKCEVGQCGTFYLGTTDGQRSVKTFTGLTVTTDVTKNGMSIIFRRHGKTYRGIEQKDADCFNFKRIK